MQAPHRRALITGSTTTTKIMNQFLQMNIVGDVLSSRYDSLSSNNISHPITNSQVVEASDNDSLAKGITLKSFQLVTSEMAKTQVYLR